MKKLFSGKSSMRILSLLIAVVLAFQLPVLTGPVNAADSGMTFPLFGNNADSGLLRAPAPANVDFGKSLKVVSLKNASKLPGFVVGEELKNMTNVPPFLSVRIDYEYEIKDSGITADTVLEFYLPDEIWVQPTGGNGWVPFEIQADGKVISQYGHIYPKELNSDGTVKKHNRGEFKFKAEAVQDYAYQGSKGTFFVAADLDADFIGNKGKTDLTFKDDGAESIIITVDFGLRNQPEPTATIKKSITNDTTSTGDVNLADQTITWHIEFTPKVEVPANSPAGSDEIFDLTLTDELPEGLSYKSATITGNGIDPNDAALGFDTSSGRNAVYTQPAGHTFTSGETYKVAIVSEFPMSALGTGDNKTFTNPKATLTYKCPKLVKDGNGTFVLDVPANGTPLTKESTGATATVPSGFVFKDGVHVGGYGADAALDWTVTLNKNKYTINNAVITDDFPEWVELDETTLKLTVGGVTKALTNDNNLSSDYTYSITTAQPQKLVIRIDTLADEAVLTYSTEIDPDFFLNNSASQQELTNKVTLAGEEGAGPGTGDPIAYDAEKGVKAGVGLLTKTGTYDRTDHSLLWTITVNGNKQSLTNVDELTDEIPEGQELIPLTGKDSDPKDFTNDDINITGPGATIIDNGKASGTIHISMPSSISETYTIQYRTRLKDSENTKWAVNNKDGIKTTPPPNVSNKAELVWNGGTLDATTSVPVPSQLLTKTKDGKYDYQNRTLGWKAEINENKMKITNLVLADVFDEGHTLYYDADGKPALAVGGVVPERITSESKRRSGEYTYTYDEATRTLKLYYGTPTEFIHDKVTVTYRTQADPAKLKTNNSSSAQYYIANTAQLTGEELPDPLTTPVTYTAKQGLPTNGVVTKKYLSQNKETESVKWELFINKNRAQFTPKIDDILKTSDSELSYKPNSTRLYKLTLDADGKEASREEVLPITGLLQVTYTPASFKLSFEFKQDITEAYIIEYETYIEAYSNNKIVKNGVKVEGSEGTNTSTGTSKEIGFTVAGGDASLRKRSIKVTKNDNENSQPIAGVVFCLKAADGSVLDTQTTDANGIATFVDIRTRQNYTIEEVSRPAGYTGIVTHPINKLPAEAGEYAVTLTNQPILASFEVKKVDAYQPGGVVTPLAGAKFKLTKNGDASFTAVEKTTDASGLAKFEKLRVGTYTVEEIEAPAGYILPTPPTYSFTVADDSTKPTQAFTHTFTNELKPGALVVTKLDKDTNAALAGAEFKLFADGTLVETKTTGADGKAVFTTKLARGVQYEVREAKAPQGYIRNTKVESFKVTKPNEQVTFAVRNTRILGRVEITKKDAFTGSTITNNPATFALEKDGDAAFGKKTATTGATGIAVFEQLPTGSYTITETSAPTGYIAGTVPLKVTVKEESAGGTAAQIVPMEYKNAKNLGSLTVTKRDAETDELLAGAEFTLYADGKEIAKMTSDAAGKAVFTGLTEGKAYEVKETKAPVNYVLSTETHAFNITESGQAETFTFHNKLLRGTLVVTKTDIFGERLLAGAEIGVCRAGETKPLLTIVTAADGKAVFADLTAGGYYYTELKAPSGYQLDKTKYNFTIQKDGEVLAVQLKNTRVSSGGGDTPSSWTPEPDPAPPAPPAEPPVTNTVEQDTDIIYPKNQKPDNSTGGKLSIPPDSTVALGKPPANGTVTIAPDGTWKYVPHPEFQGTDSFTLYVTNVNGVVEAVTMKVNILSALVNALPQTGEGGRMGYYLGGTALMLCGLTLNVMLRRKAHR